jgi:hypothetical protein
MADGASSPCPATGDSLPQIPGVSEEHRLVYLVDGDDLVILQARFHYK